MILEWCQSTPVWRRYCPPWPDSAMLFDGLAFLRPLWQRLPEREQRPLLAPALVRKLPEMGQCFKGSRRPTDVTNLWFRKRRTTRI